MEKHPKEAISLMNMCLIRDSAGRLLAQKRQKDFWPGYALPGGHVEKGEALTDSVIREIREETGLEIRHPRLVGVKDWLTDVGRDMVLLYVAEEFSGTVRSSEEGMVCWLTPEELLARPTASHMKELLQVFLREELSEYFVMESGGVRRDVLQ